jgi:putative addiction module antidote
MSAPLKLIAIGNSTGVIIPKEMLARLRVEKGDTVYCCETPEGLELRAHDPEFARQMEIAERVMRKDRNVLKKLAE